MGLKEYLSGILGEDKACAYLKKQGFVILQRNFHSKFGELDIIAKKDEILHFIEVKSTQGDYEVAYRLHQKKYEKLLKAIDFYFLQQGFISDFQIDLLCVKSNAIDFRENISF
ncbi:YraN family protein [Campylobacter sp. MIT 12-8780]|uniref:YraN family protein n=1 Tax=unclassified Campylobacter TaxID=2593542 RepID=UPI00115E40BD|nr:MULTISPECIES: YraN family protein [unclassified Campylobacter]NDJ27034.1 YraN family protein [Campylobacter sp. MIT 19-121]TQR41664.1 YraN family protein [Campylobacter sp. MIT 12-8780]